MIRLNQGVTLSFLALLAAPTVVRAEQPSFAIDLKDLDRQKPAPPAKAETQKVQKQKVQKQKVQKQKKQAPRHEEHEAPHHKGDYVTYTVKPGDYIFKILIGKFGMSEERAERLVPEIIRINDISNIRNLQVGRKLLIPCKEHEHTARVSKREGRPHKAERAVPAVTHEGAALLEEKGEPMAPVAPPPVAPPPVAPPPATPVAPVPPPAAPAAPAAPAPAKESSVKAAAPSPIPTAPIWVCSIPQKDPGAIVDSILNALSVTWCRNRIVQSEHSASIPFSIRVDRYFEYKGGRYIVSVGEGDAYSYTLMRLLEDAGYKVLRLGAEEDFKSVGEKLLTMMGVAPDFGKHALQGGKELPGFLVQQDDAGGRRVIITSQPADRNQKWVMGAGCSAR